MQIVKTMTMAVLLIVILNFTACNSDRSGNESIQNNTAQRVFSELSVPSGISELELWLAQIPTKIQESKSKIFLASTHDWENVILPYQLLVDELRDDEITTSQIMRKSSDPELRALGYKAYGELMQYKAELTLDQNFSDIEDLDCISHLILSL